MAGEAFKEIPWSGVETEWLSNEDMGAEYGAALMITVPPGGGYETHGHNGVERVVYLVRGAGVHNGDGGSVDIAADDALVLPPGSWHGFQNSGDDEAVLLMLYTPATSFPADDYQRPDGGEEYAQNLIRHRLHDVPGRPDVSTPERGFDGFQVNWDGAAGSKETVLGFARFPAGSTHRWHRHTRADEGCYFLSGRAYHCYVEDGVEKRMPAAPGVHLWIPKNQWHTLVTDPDCPMCDCVWWYLGGAHLDETGYELRENVAV